jgi:hypothetical protein
VRYAVLALLAGCYSFSSLGRARTVGKHHVEVFGAPELLAIPGGQAIAGRPVGELGARVGLSDRVDVEARVTTLGVGAAAELQLASHVLAAPGIALTSPDKLAFELPVRFGIDLGRHQLILAPRLAYQLRFGVPVLGSVSYLLAGGSVGFALRLSRRLTFLPEVAFLGQLWATPGFTSNVASTVGTQLALGVLYDF